MKGVCGFILLGICAGWISAQFLNHRPFPTYSLENMPDTAFSCRDKILGGYYADPEAQCQMFHVCVKVAGVGVQDFRFLCPNGTAFDQDHQICAEWEDVDCDATTLYYASDNFDLYRIGSGLESKAVKYGEDEETFALQRAETGDIRLNREHQSQRVNQQKETQFKKNRPQQQNYNRPQNQEKPRNNQEEDYNQNQNYNRNNQEDSRRQKSQNNYSNQQNQNNFNQDNRRQNNQARPQNNDRDIFKTSSSSNFYNNRNNGKENDDDYDDNVNYNQDRDDFQRRKSNKNRPTARPRPTGFSNNFAGSSYVTTTSRPSTTLTDQQYSQAINNYRGRQGHRTNTVTSTPAYTLSSPAPFRQTQQYNRQNSQNPSTDAPYRKETDNYPTKKISNENYPTPAPAKYDFTRVKQIENHSTTIQKQTFNQYSTTKSATYPTPAPKPSKETENYPQNFPTTSRPLTPTRTTFTDNYPSTFAPRTNAAYSQITQQTTQYKQNTQKSFTQQYESQRTNTTPRTTPFTQYTPTVPKITSTTPVARSNRFDETQYDDGSYDRKYDRNNDEFLNTAHSQNIASSRNEYLKTTKNAVQSTQKPYYEAPRPFSVTSNSAKSPSTTRAPVEKTTNFKNQSITPKKTKNVSYDYAYYDSNVGSEADYEIDTEIKKSTSKN